jgi:alkylation response protein AidB-like acyl-CoA dehydrogenase
VFTVFATLNPGTGARGITAFLVEAGTPGLTVGRAIGADMVFRVADQTLQIFGALAIQRTFPSSVSGARCGW